MENKFTPFLFLFCFSINLVHCEYFHSETIAPHNLPNKVTHLHFYYFDIHTGNNPSAVIVAHANKTNDPQKNPSMFGTVFAIDNPLREGPEETSKVVGNAQGLYVSSSQSKDVTLTMYVDFAFTSGDLNGSSFSILSRNLVTEPTRGLAVVGGRGKFRMATGFALIRAHFLNVTTGDGIIEYNVTIFHH